MLEQGCTFEPSTIRAGAVIFVEAFQLGDFIHGYLPAIRKPFVLITHNGDLNIDATYLNLARDDRVVHWFAQNCILRHPKITAIPIGLENRRRHTNGVVRDYRGLQRRRSRKRMRVLYGFTLSTNEREREPALRALRRASIADPLERTNSREYRTRLEQYGFIASPPGNGVDCHRTWEALYLRTIPIVKRSAFYDSFPDLPLLAVDDWSEICGWDADFLEKSYVMLSAAIDTTPFLNFGYWAAMIERSRSKIEMPGW